MSTFSGWLCRGGGSKPWEASVICNTPRCIPAGACVRDRCGAEGSLGCPRAGQHGETWTLQNVGLYKPRPTSLQAVCSLLTQRRVSGDLRYLYTEPTGHRAKAHPRLGCLRCLHPLKLSFWVSKLEACPLTPMRKNF